MCACWVNLMQVAGKKMAASGRGGPIVNISSQLSSLAIGGMLAYSLSKAGLNMATKMFAPLSQTGSMLAHTR